MNGGKVVASVLAGLAVGALLGVLFAPAKGSTTRRRILKKGEAYAENIKESIGDLKDDISEKIDMAKEEATRFANEKIKAAKRAMS